VANAPFDPIRNGNEKWLTNPDSLAQALNGETMKFRPRKLRRCGFWVTIDHAAVVGKQCLRAWPAAGAEVVDAYTLGRSSVKETGKRKVDGFVERAF
jgi:hypothetical protein